MRRPHDMHRAQVERHCHGHSVHQHARTIRLPGKEPSPITYLLSWSNIAFLRPHLSKGGDSIYNGETQREAPFVLWWLGFEFALCIVRTLLRMAQS